MEMKVLVDWKDRDSFYKYMVLSVERIEFNTDTQMYELFVKHKSYDDL